MMFNMKIEKQLNIKDRTLLLGVPDFDVVPESIKIDNAVYKVIGISHGVKPPFLSIEIEKTENELVGKIAMV